MVYHQTFTSYRYMVYIYIYMVYRLLLCDYGTGEIVHINISIYIYIILLHHTCMHVYTYIAGSRQQTAGSYYYYDSTTMCHMYDVVRSLACLRGAAGMVHGSTEARKCVAAGPRHCTHQQTADSRGGDGRRIFSKISDRPCSRRAVEPAGWTHLPPRSIDQSINRPC